MTKEQELDEEAERLVARAAPGQEFELLHRRGWKPRSQREGSGLEPCPPDCGVCYPTLSPVRRRRRRRR